MEAEKIDFSNLKRKSVHGGILSICAQLTTVFIQTASLVILARLLTPEDYGIIAMAAVIIAFADLFRDLGLSAAAIQKKELTNKQQTNLFWLNIIVGGCLMIFVSNH